MYTSKINQRNCMNAVENILKDTEIKGLKSGPISQKNPSQNLYPKTRRNSSTRVANYFAIPDEAVEELTNILKRNKAGTKIELEPLRSVQAVLNSAKEPDFGAIEEKYFCRQVAIHMAARNNNYISKFAHKSQAYVVRRSPITYLEYCLEICDETTSWRRQHDTLFMLAVAAMIQRTIHIITLHHDFGHYIWKDQTAYGGRAGVFIVRVLDKYYAIGKFHSIIARDHQ